MPKLDKVDVREDLLVADVVDEVPWNPFEEYFDRRRRARSWKPTHLVFGSLTQTESVREVIRFHEEVGPLYSRSSSPENFPRRRFHIPLQEFWGQQQWFSVLLRLPAFVGRSGDGGQLRQFLLNAVEQNPYECDKNWPRGLPRGLMDKVVTQEDLTRDLRHRIRRMQPQSLGLLADWLFTGSLNKRLEDCPFQIRPKNEYGYYLFLPRANDLLGSFYAMLALDAANGIQIGFCADPHCLKPFQRERVDQIYCDRNCAVRVAVREHYRRTKKRRVKFKSAAVNNRRKNRRQDRGKGE